MTPLLQSRLFMIDLNIADISSNALLPMIAGGHNIVHNIVLPCLINSLLLLIRGNLIRLRTLSEFWLEIKEQKKKKVL